MRSTKKTGAGKSTSRKERTCGDCHYFVGESYRYIGVNKMLTIYYKCGYGDGNDHLGDTIQCEMFKPKVVVFETKKTKK